MKPGGDVLAFVERGLKLEVLPWQRAIVTRMMGRRAAEDILVRRVTYCMGQGLHVLNGHCPACGVAPKKRT